MMIYPTQNDYRQYFATMSKELLSVWIEVAERKLPHYTRIEEVETVKAALIAARCALAARQQTSITQPTKVQTHTEASKMNDNPRLVFFDVDPDKFATMLNELIEQDIVCEVEDDYDDSMDGDWDSAMASAGFGTDEDYGIFDDYNDFYGEE